MYNVEKKSEDRFSFVAQMGGPYKFCFFNSMSTFTPKTVNFQVQVENRVDPNKKPKGLESSSLFSSISLTTGLSST